MKLINRKSLLMTAICLAMGYGASVQATMVFHEPLPLREEDEEIDGVLTALPDPNDATGGIHNFFKQTLPAGHNMPANVTVDLSNPKKAIGICAFNEFGVSMSGLQVTFGFADGTTGTKTWALLDASTNPQTDGSCLWQDILFIKPGICNR
jgi:hypothetical protein